MTSDSIPPSLIAATEPDDAARASILQGSGGPGRAIRAARERARLTLEELAGQTKLTRVTLEALERDDFEALNEPVYVRGYYRKCAKVLVLSEADLIAGYEKLAVPKAPQVPTKLLLGSSPAIGRPRARRRSGSGRLAGIVVIAAAIGAVAWFVMNDPGLLAGLRGNSAQTATPVAAEPAAQPISSAPAHLLPDATTAGAVTASEAAATAAPHEAGTTAAIGASDPATGAPAAPVSGPAQASGSSSAPASVPVPVPAPAASPSAAPVAVNSGNVAAAAASPASAEAASSAGSLTLTFKSTSWIRVEDADGHVLLSGVVQAGDRQQLRGRTPYNLFVGNAPGVVVEYDGKAIDTAPFVKSNSTARLTVP